MAQTNKNESCASLSSPASLSASPSASPSASLSGACCSPAPDLAACCARAESLLEPEFFRALGDPSRIGVLMRLAELSGPATVSEISSCCPQDLSVVSRHLKVLRRAGMVDAERRGKEVRYRLLYQRLASTLREMADAIDACCPPRSSSENSSKGTRP